MSRPQTFLRTPARASTVRLSLAILAAICSAFALSASSALGQAETTAPGYPVGFNPTQLAIGPDGSLYASDCAAARVYRIGPDGVSVAIGSGPGGFSPGFVGDGGPATEAQTLCPYGIAFDPEGRLLLVDHGNNRVRRVDAAGVISTIAGSGPGKFLGGFAGDGGPATEGLMQEPTAIAVDAEGAIFVSDRDNDRVRRIGVDGVITTVAGNGAASFSGDGGPALDASLDDPAGLAVDDEGNLYIADSNHHRVRRVSLDGIIDTVAGSDEAGSDGDGGPATEATLTDPESLLLDAAGNLYIGDPGANRIRVITPDGTITTFAGGGEGSDGGPATEAALRLPGDPASLAIDASGAIYIGDSGNHAIRVVDPTGMISTLEVGASPDESPRLLPTDCPTPLAPGSIATVAGGGTGGDGEPATEARVALTVGTVAVDDAGALYLSSYGLPTIRRVGTDGLISTVFTDASASLNSIAALAFGPSGDLYVADNAAARIYRIATDGSITTVAGTGTVGSTGDEGPAPEAEISATMLSVGPGGELHFDDVNRFRYVDRAGVIHAFAGTGEPGFGGDEAPATEALLGEVGGAAVGLDGEVYLADYGNQRIRRVDREGVITTIAGTGERGYTGDGGPATGATLSDPVVMVVDTDGSLYFSDHHNHVVRRIDRAGTITTVAGTGKAGFSGDCGPATEAQLDQPWGIAIRDGVLYIVDMGNGRVRAVVL